MNTPAMIGRSLEMLRNMKEKMLPSLQVRKSETDKVVREYGRRAGEVVNSAFSSGPTPLDPIHEEEMILKRKQQQKSWDLLKNRLLEGQNIPEWFGEVFLFRKSKNPITFKRLLFTGQGKKYVIFEFENESDIVVKRRDTQHLQTLFQELPLTLEVEPHEWDEKYRKNSSGPKTVMPVSKETEKANTINIESVSSIQGAPSSIAKKIDEVLGDILGSNGRVQSSLKSLPKNEESIKATSVEGISSVLSPENLNDGLPGVQVIKEKSEHLSRQSNTVRNTVIGTSLAVGAILVGYSMLRGSRTPNIPPIQAKASPSIGEKNLTQSLVGGAIVNTHKEAMPKIILKSEITKSHKSEQKTTSIKTPSQHKQNITPAIQASLDIVKPDTWKQITKGNTIWGICKKNKIPDAVWKSYKKHAVIIQKNGTIVFPINAKKLPIGAVLAIRKVPINPKEFHQNIASSKQKGNSEKPTTKAQALLESPTISQVIESVRQSQNIILDTPIIKVNGGTQLQKPGENLYIPRNEPVQKITLLTTHEESKEFLQKLIANKKEGEAWKNKKIHIHDTTNIQGRDVIFEKLTYVGDIARMKVHEGEKTFYIPVDKISIDSLFLSLPAAPVAWKDLPDRSMERFSTFVDERLANMKKNTPSIQKETLWGKFKSLFS